LYERCLEFYWAPISIFESFIRKLSKRKGYVSIEDSAQVNNLDQTFKVFEGEAFDKKVHTLTDTSNILDSLFRRKSPKLEWVSWVTKNYNLHS